MKKNETRRRLCASIALAPWLAHAAVSPDAVKKPAAPNWRLLINEAVTGETNIFLLTSRYQPLADYLGQHVKGRVVGIEPVVDIRRFMSLAQGESKPDLVFGKSVNQLAKLVRDHGYQPLVRRADPYKAAFIVEKSSPIRSLAEIGQARIVMPDEFAATTAVARAELKRLNIANPIVMHVRYQEAVEQQVKSGMGQVGVVNPTIARKWAADGGRILAETQPVVNWSLLAGPGMGAETATQLRDVLLAMNKQATSVLGSLGIKEWARAERQDYLALLDYTRE
ncbi:phosphate/phosphite/phosphonate ABC transporter substrate-binding protein [Ramlibacter sp. PS4R-6]|uniref:phosphate/phosphite/phosphonate ABC transporter substrate-binding protein n=1 Tax=Ramlibacter sp. PS4R-6 TaxID=3133438 RepID=UPI0030985E93